MRMKNLRNVTLELSAKALHDPSPEAMVRVARTMFRQWRSLTELADQVSVLLWVADGSELLDWSGTMSDTFEWACWCGCANPFSVPENPTPRQRRNTFAFPAKVFPDRGFASGFLAAAAGADHAADAVSFPSAVPFPLHHRPSVPEADLRPAHPSQRL